MEQLVDTIIRCDINQIKDCKFPKDERFGLAVTVNDVDYEFILNIKSTSNKLLVFAPAARHSTESDEDKARPVFHRWSWKFDESTIHFNDPTTYLSQELLGGWGIGSEDDWYLQHISDILNEIFDNLNFEHENITFYGSSLGGFLSIMLSILIKNTKSIAEVPQFDVTLWGKHWPLLKKHCFNDKDEEYIKKEYGYRIDCIEMMKKENYIPDAYIIIDCSYDYDYEHINLPFFKRLDELPYEKSQNNIKMRLDGKNKGHIFLPYGESLKVVNKTNRPSYEEIKDMERELEELRTFKKDVLNSNSWKYTNSLRKISGKIKK